MSLFHTESFWKIVLGEDWAESLYPNVIALNPGFCRSLGLISELYNKGEEIYPKDKADIFKAFRECPRDKCKVIFLGQDPYPNSMATGLAFANPRDTLPEEYSPSLRILQDALERSYPGTGEFLDPSLMFWAKQGVLLLNSSLTVSPTNKFSFQSIWNRFISGVIKTVTRDTNKVIILLGNVAKTFKSDIDFFNWTITAPHPAFNARNNTALDLDFREIDRYLKNHGGEKIQWVKIP